jgi:hypothetical protein
VVTPMISEPAFIRSHWWMITLSLGMLGTSAAIFILAGVGMFR